MGAVRKRRRTNNTKVDGMNVKLIMAASRSQARTNIQVPINSNQMLNKTRAIFRPS